MSVPFGKHPTLEQYLYWIEECGGHLESGVGLQQNYIKITTAEGFHAFVIGLDRNERLVPTMVNSLDRRLHVTSPWHRFD